MNILARKTRSQTYTKCQQLHQQRLLSMVVWQGWWLPKCDALGNFESEQCDNTGRHSSANFTFLFILLRVYVLFLDPFSFLSKDIAFVWLLTMARLFKAVKYLDLQTALRMLQLDVTLPNVNKFMNCAWFLSSCTNECGHQSVMLMAILNPCSVTIQARTYSYNQCCLKTIYKRAWGYFILSRIQDIKCFE